MSIAEPVTSTTTPAWTLGDRLSKARRHAKLEQRDVAEALGVSRALVSMWERDLAEPRMSQVQKFAQLTKVEFAWLASMYKRDFGVIEWSEDAPVQNPLPLDPVSLTSLRGGLTTR